MLPVMMKPLTLCLMTVLAIPALAADQWANAQPMTVIMIDNSFQPDHLTFEQGKPYELRLENHGKDMHEFTAPAFLKAATIKDKHLLANGGTDIVVQSGTSVRVLLIAPAKGHYDLTCADHDWDGMVGNISVD
jgi:plastocyanin